MQMEQTPLRSNKEHVLYEVESLFTNISMDEKISCIINDIDWKNMLPQIYSKIIFRRLLYKLTTEVLLQLETNETNQGSEMVVPLSVPLGDIHMIRMRLMRSHNDANILQSIG